MSRAYAWIDWGAQATIYDLLGIVGIAIAVVQLWRSKSAFKAARGAYLKTKEHLVLMQILRATTRLRAASGALDRALQSTDRQGPDAHLESFAYTAVTTSELVRIYNPTEVETIETLAALAKVAGEARATLYNTLDQEVEVGRLIGDPASQMRDYLNDLEGTMTRIGHSSQKAFDTKWGSEA